MLKPSSIRFLCFAVGTLMIHEGSLAIAVAFKMPEIANAIGSIAAGIILGTAYFANIGNRDK